MVDLGDISNALSKICRFAGHTKQFYSVAQHSMHVAELVEHLGGTTEEILQALLHDAPEAYVVDVPTPLKRLLGAAYEETERKVWNAISELFEVSSEISELVHYADKLMLNVEAEQLLNEPEYGDPWWTPRSKLVDVPEDIVITGKTSDHANIASEYAFLLGSYYSKLLQERLHGK